MGTTVLARTISGSLQTIYRQVSENTEQMEEMNSEPPDGGGDPDGDSGDTSSLEKPAPSIDFSQMSDGDIRELLNRIQELMDDDRFAVGSF